MAYSANDRFGSRLILPLSILLGLLGTPTLGSAANGPDFAVDQRRASENIWFDQEFFDANSCAVIEGCVARPGVRTLMHFNARILNQGNQDFELGQPGDPASHGRFIWSPCHGHYHVIGWADYSVQRSTPQGSTDTVLVGRKQAFCIEDTHLTSGSREAKYTCNYQGITAGWADEYASNLPCQWLDVTEVTPGAAQLKINVNPDRVYYETNYENNEAIVSVFIPSIGELGH